MQEIVSFIGYVFVASLGILLLVIIWHVIIALVILAYKQLRRSL